MSYRLASFIVLCGAVTAGAAQAGNYQLASTFSGTAYSADLDNFGFNDLSIGDVPTPFSITLNAVVDYSGSGALYAWGTNVEVTISLAGIPAQSVVLQGGFDAWTNAWDSGPNAGLSQLSQYVTIPSGDNGMGLRFGHTITYATSLAPEPFSLPLQLPLGATSGAVEYWIYYRNDAGDFGVESLYGEVDSASFSLSPVPEPSTWTMLAAGLALTGAIARRRRA